MLPSATATIAWVPTSSNPTARIWGNGRGVSSPSALPYTARLAGVSGMSIITPSMAITRQSRSHAPGVVRVAIGTATAS